jgi:Cu(I)/Ag(I) efflux system protein CusF
MRSCLLVLTSITCLLFGTGSYAAGGDSSADNAAATTSAESEQAMTAGLVKKVDKGAGKVTISHGPIENLGMPKMTMVFHVKDPAMLDRLKEGDEIRFVADKVNGALTVMRFEQAK